MINVTRIVIFTIVVNYLPQLHDPIVYLLAAGSFDLIVLKASIIVALKLQCVSFHLSLKALTYARLYLLSSGAFDCFARRDLLNLLLYFGDSV